MAEVMGDIRNLHARRAVAMLDREQLVDKHLNLMEENLMLKKHARSQEEKIKRMATKLIRLTSDEKKEARKDGGQLSGLQLRQLEIEREEVTSELQSKIKDLEKQCTSYKGKITVLKQQLETRGKRHTPYDHIQSRISTGIQKKPLKSVSTDDLAVKKPSATSNAGTQHSVSCHNLLEEVRSENQELEESVLQLQQTVAVLKAENERLKDQSRVESLRHEKEKLRLQEELQAQITDLSKTNANNEIELMQLQSELRDKSNRLQTLQAKYLTLERNVEAAKSSHSRVIKEMEVLNDQLKQERKHSSQLKTELHCKSISLKANSELQEMVDDLRAEKALLQQANGKLLKGDSDRDQQQRVLIKSLQERIKELESATKADHSQKTAIIDQLSSERELCERLDSELKELRAMYNEVKKENNHLHDQLKFFSKESSVDWGEVEEALVVVREKKERGLGALSFLEKVEDDTGKHDLEELRIIHADTISELEKTRKMLQMQHNINRDYKKEIDVLKSQLVEKENELNAQLQEHAQLFDIKSARVKKLESQLKDIAYGSRPYKVDTSRFEHVDEGELEESIELERGQNLLQVNISQVTLSPAAVTHLGCDNPSLFTTFTYSDFETQVTPVVQGRRPLFGFTSNFVVMVDDSFLQHLQVGSIPLEVNQALGLKYQRIAVANLKLKELITSAGSKIQGKLVLTGVDNMESCLNVGSLEYWMRLKLPVTQAIRLYQERRKALSVIEHHPECPPSTTPVHGVDYNELTITITQCQGLKPLIPGHSPCPYVMYKFYTYPDHDTPIVTNSTDPKYSDCQVYPISMTQSLNSYLKTESLSVYVFDNEEVDENSYIGVARVPLAKLAQGKNMSGKFQLITSADDPAGFIEMELAWNSPYLMQKEAAVSLPPHMKDVEEFSVERRSLKEVSLKRNEEAVINWTVNSSHKASIPPEDVDSNHPESDVLSEVPVLSESHSNPVTVVKPKPSSHKTPVVHSKKGAKPSLIVRSSRTKAASMNPKQSVGLKNSLPPLRKVGVVNEDGVTSARSGPDKTSAEFADIATESEHDEVFYVTETEISSMSGIQSGNEEVVEGRNDQNATIVSNTLKEGEDSKAVVNSVSGDSSEGGVEDGDGGDVGGENSDGGDDFGEDGGLNDSATVTDITEDLESVAEEIEEEAMTDEVDNSDTMFEETLQQENSVDDFSGLSEHSSDEIHPPPVESSPISKKVIEVEQDDESVLSELTPTQSEVSVEEDGKPITLTEAASNQDTEQVSVSTVPPSVGIMSITVESFTMETDSSIADNADVSKLFVEYQFLDYDYGELETPTSLQKPQPGETINFNFKKVFKLDTEKQALLRAMMKSEDSLSGRITFTVVNDPDDQDADCDELGTAELDLSVILKRGEDLHDECIDVISLDEEPEVLGYLTVSVQALTVLEHLT